MEPMSDMNDFSDDPYTIEDIKTSMELWKNAANRAYPHILTWEQATWLVKRVEQLESNKQNVVVPEKESIFERLETVRLKVMQSFGEEPTSYNVGFTIYDYLKTNMEALRHYNKGINIIEYCGVPVYLDVSLDANQISFVTPTGMSKAY